MATETAFRPHVDQENAPTVNTKGGTVLGRSFGAVKSFQSSNIPSATPRRALGDVGNTIQPVTAKVKKGLSLKPTCSKTNGKTPKIFQGHTGTPAIKGLPLLQQISSAGFKQSSKQNHTSHVRTTGKQKVRLQEPCQREVMYPFTEKEDVLPRSNCVSTILKNVGALYQGCMFQPYAVPVSDPEERASNYIHFEEQRRPMKETYFIDSLPFEGDLASLTQDLKTNGLPEIELSPVDIDSLGLDVLQ